jgi:hypothetical protein
MNEMPEMTKRYWSTQCAPKPALCSEYSQPPLCSMTTQNTQAMRATSSSTQRFFRVDWPAARCCCACGMAAARSSASSLLFCRGLEKTNAALRVYSSIMKP